MKLIHLILLFLTFGVTLQAQSNKKRMNEKLLRHIVLFKYKDTAGAAGIKVVEHAFLELPSKIKQIKSIEWGLNNSPEHLNQGFTHCFYLTFKSEADRDSYLIHPDHKAFGKVLGPYLDKVLVFDYWAQ